MLTPDSIVPDPANPQSLNRYSYVNNRPLSLTDPTGHFECESTEIDCMNTEQAPYRPPYIQYQAIGKPGIDRPIASSIQGLLYSVSGLGIDLIELGVSAGTTIASEPITAVGASTGPVGWLGAIIARQGLDTVETAIGNVDLGVTLLASLASGRTYYDSNTNEIVFGQDVAIVALEQIVDVGLPACPECDWALNVLALGYDVADLVESGLDLAGLETWGLTSFMEYRVPALAITDSDGNIYMIPDFSQALPRGVADGQGYILMYVNSSGSN